MVNLMLATLLESSHPCCLSNVEQRQMFANVASVKWNTRYMILLILSYSRHSINCVQRKPLSERFRFWMHPLTAFSGLNS